MKKSIIFFSFSLLMVLFGLLYISRDTKAILANETLSTNYELCRIADDDLESNNLNAVYFKNLNNLWTYNLYERGSSLNYTSYTNNSISYGLWYAVISKSQFVNTNSFYANLYINLLGSDYDDMAFYVDDTRFERFIYPIFLGSITNTLTYDDLYNSAFNSYYLNSNFLYYSSQADLYVCDSFKYSVEPNLNNFNYFYIGVFVRLYDNMILSDMSTDISCSLISQLDVDVDTTSSYNDGYDLGFQEGYNNGLLNVNQNSYNIGHDIGYNDGYLAGITANASGDNWFALGLISLFDLPLAVFGKIWDFDVLGFNFATLFFSLLSVGLFLWILRKFISK